MHRSRLSYGLALSFGVLALSAAIPSCFVLADASDLDHACATGFKYCKDIEACVSHSNPGFGCGQTSCEPCEPPDSDQVMGCVEGMCQVVACVGPGPCT